MAQNDPNNAGGPTPEQIAEMRRIAAEVRTEVGRLSLKQREQIESRNESQKGQFRALAFSRR